MSAPNRQCRCLGALKDVTEIPIQHNAVVATGLIWKKFKELHCVRRACLFCQSVKIDYACEDAPDQGRRERRDLSQERRHRRRSRHFAGGREFLFNASLVLRFTIGETSPGGYASLMLSTEMTSRDHGSLKGSWSQPLEVVGCFARLDQDKNCHYVERRLVTAQFNPAILRNWLADCEHNHRHEEVRHDTTVSSLATLISLGRLRLIDVLTHTLITATTSERYLALSYVWGESHVSRDGWIPSIAYEICGGSDSPGYAFPWESLPRTIREAADVVKSIGERYLWVDALCINQNDPKDQQQIVAEMGAIYGASLVTIVATGDNANSGLPGVSPGSRAGQAYEEMPLGDRTYQLVSSLPTLDRELDKSTWATRGWTFQEFLLSRRVVVFSPTQVYFTCAQGEQAEAYVPEGLFSDEYWQRHVHRQRMSTSLSDDVTGTMIEDFCNRKLTHCQDRFNAFMGVATLQNPKSVPTEKVTALRGLPLLSFWESLLWSPRGSEVSTRIKTNLDSSFALPSWSWVGWSGPVTMPRRNPRPRYTSKSWFEAVVLDDANIVLKPTASEDMFFLWEPWPFEPKAYSGKIHNAVTLHMWAPCVDCHLISMEGLATCPVRYPPLQGDRTVCHMIFAASPDLTTEVLDDLAQNCVNPGGRTNFLGFIWRPKDRSRQQPHRHIHRMIVFPWERREETSLLLLEENPDDPGTVCRAAVVDDPRLLISASGIPHASGERHTHKVRQRYIRMQ